MSTITIPCQWFALCDHDAVGVVEHPVLGSVPTCRRCATKHDLDLIECEFKEAS